MKKIKFFLLTFLMSGFISAIHAQGTDPEKVPMADLMHRDGKIYVVVAVMLTILAGLILYIIRLDKKISRMEKEK
jgi:CcmD family protein